MKKGNNYQTILLFLAITLLALMAGVAGELISRQYILSDLYGFPSWKEVDLSRGELNRSQIVINGAKEITIEQNKKIEEAIEKSRQSLVGIFGKNSIQKTSLKEKNSFYNLRAPFSQGFIVTTDGWIITEFPQNIELKEEDLKERYVVIDEEQNFYSIKEAKKSSIEPFWFLRLEGAKELPVKKIIPEPEIKKGELVLTLNWEGKNYLSYISEKTEFEDNLIQSSDLFLEELVLTNDIKKEFNQGFVFSLKEGIVGIVSQEGVVHSVNNFTSSFNNLLKGEEKNSPVLGVNFINLSSVFLEEENLTQGALIYPDKSGLAVKENSPAEKAGLQEGDIIISVNGQTINAETPFNYLVQKYSPGDNINITYLRAEKENNVSIILE